MCQAEVGVRDSPESGGLGDVYESPFGCSKVRCFGGHCSGVFDSVSPHREADAFLDCCVGPIFCNDSSAGWFVVGGHLISCDEDTRASATSCLLSTSDAADAEDSVHPAAPRGWHTHYD